MKAGIEASIWAHLNSREIKLISLLRNAVKVVDMNITHRLRKRLVRWRCCGKDQLS